MKVRAALLILMAFAINLFAADEVYYPPSESAGGWRWCKDKDQVRSLAEIRRFATVESPQLGQMRLTTWQKSCALFHLDPALAGQLANFSILHAVYGKEDGP